MKRAFITSGKGGVGKTLSSCSLALQLSKTEKTGIIDFDGGHSVKETLRIKETIEPNSVVEVRPNLFVSVIENIKFKNAFGIKNKTLSFEEYFLQFEQDLGFVAYCDMINAFFGVPTDIDGVQKFIILSQKYFEMKKLGVENLIIDLEPTAGFKRFLCDSKSTISSLQNLKNNGVILLGVIGFAWPDIAKFLKSKYIKDIDKYTNNLQETIEEIRNANFLLATIPQFNPVKQVFEVSKIVKEFDGKTYGIIINNVRGEQFEEENIKILKTLNLPLVKIPYTESLHLNQDQKFTIESLEQIGEKIISDLSK